MEAVKTRRYGDDFVVPLADGKKESFDETGIRRGTPVNWAVPNDKPPVYAIRLLNCVGFYRRPTAAAEFEKRGFIDNWSPVNYVEFARAYSDRLPEGHAGNKDFRI